MSIACRVLFLAVLSALTLSATDESYAGFERRCAGPRSYGMAGVLSTFGEDAWSFYSNPARTASAVELGLFYVPATFGLQEVKSMGIAYRNHAFGLDLSGAVQTFGCEIYRETTASAGVSLPLSDFLFIGSNLNVNHLFIENYGTDMAVSLDAGSRMFLSDHFALGICITNFNSASMTTSNDRLPQTVTGGIGYLSDEFNIGIEYFKEVGFPSAARVAAEYSPLTFITVRGGSASGSGSFNAGVSLKVAPFKVEYGATFHQVLGTTHSLGLSIEFSGGKTEFENIQNYRQSLRRR